MNKNKNHFIPYGRQTITEKDIENVVSVLRSDLITQGPIVNVFEESIAKKVSSNYAVATNSATSALHIACLALGLKKGDWLWTSSITFVASANCGLYCGAKIDFIDINPQTGLICIESLSLKLQEAEKNGKLPKVLIPVHLGGASCDMKEIKKLADKYGFLIIEDASHAIGGKYHESPVGSCSYSSITIFSLHPVKIITAGEGGIATTNDINLYQKMISLRSHGIEKNRDKFFEKTTQPWKYEQQLLGFNYRITDIQCALGLSQLERLENIVEERNRLLNRYQKLLIDLPINLLEIPKDVLSSVHLAIIRLESSSPKIHENIFKYLRTNNIGVQLHYSPVHLQYYFRNLGFKDGYLPNSEDYGVNAITIPLFPGLNDEEQEFIVSHITKALSLNSEDNRLFKKL